MKFILSAASIMDSVAEMGIVQTAKAWLAPMFLDFSGFAWLGVLALSLALSVIPYFLTKFSTKWMWKVPWLLRSIIFSTVVLIPSMFFIYAASYASAFDYENILDFGLFLSSSWLPISILAMIVYVLPIMINYLHVLNYESKIKQTSKQTSN